MNVDRKQHLNFLYQVCVFGLIGKIRWLPWPLIGRDIFDFSSETAERNSTKLVRKQDLKVLYKVFVFGPIGKIRWLAWPLIGWDIFDFSSESAERNSRKLDRNQDLNVLYQVCVFWADRKNKMASPVSHWLRHSRLFLWNHEMEFNESWPEARSQRPLPSLLFFRPISKQNWPPWPIRLKGGTLYSGARYVALWASCFVLLTTMQNVCWQAIGWIRLHILLSMILTLSSNLVRYITLVVCSVQWLVIDESDKLFEDGKTGFREQVCIINE